MKKKLLIEMKATMDNVIQELHAELAKVRTGRASLSILDEIRVSCYNSMMPINQLASLAVPESRLITIQPWDAKVIGNIEKAILQSDLGLNPTNDGKIIRITIPPLTEERRLEFVKLARKLAEERRITIRNIRRDINEKFKSLEKEKEISQDELHRCQTEVQEITDDYIKKVGEILEHKEKDILEV
jgi:ribosome recycling factor